ncbi:MAG: pilus assembly protein PilX [Proteobacteria bacterium]|nr:pilus assembly protein PilX [Pseudomonadota bacterium]
MPQRRPPAPCPRRLQQRGVALFVVIVFVMLSMLLALWASRTSLFNEMVVGNDADYQRAFEAAQALLQDAELDIRNQKADGTACSGTGDVCRTGIGEQIPLEAQDVGPLLAALDAKTTKCSKGLCVKRMGKQDFWNNTDASQGPTLAQMADAAVGARYGQFTGAGTGSTSAPINPILQWDNSTRANQGGWYWIEVLPYDESSKNSALIAGTPNNYLPLNLTPSVVYRITALAYGRKQGTQVVLQQTYAPQKTKD